MTLQHLLRINRLAEHEADSGDDVDEGSVLACAAAAEQLRVRVLDWGSSNRPELIA